MESGSQVHTLEGLKFGKWEGEFQGYQCCLLVGDKNWSMKVAQQCVVY